MWNFMDWSSLLWKLLPKRPFKGGQNLTKITLYRMIFIFHNLIKHNLMELWWNFQFLSTCCSRIKMSKEPKIDRKYPKISENSTLGEFYRLKTFTMPFILNTTFMLYTTTMYLCATFHHNSILCLYVRM